MTIKCDVTLDVPVCVRARVYVLCMHVVCVFYVCVCLCLCVCVSVCCRYIKCVALLVSIKFVDS